MIQFNEYNGGAEELSNPCSRCGVCCTKYQVRLGLAEAQHIAYKLGIGWDEWLNLYTDRRWPGTASFLLRHCNGACVFLEQTKVHNVTLCLIQSFKPSACRDWMPSLYQHDCREGLIKQGK